MTTFRSIEALIEEAKKQWAYTKPHLPQVIMKEISLRPSWGIDCVSHLEKHDWHLDEERTEILLRLIDEGLGQIRYSVDRKETAGSVLRKQLEKTLIQVIPTLPQEARVAVNQLLFEAKISIDLEIEESDYTGDCPPQTQIMPRLPELLDEIRREKVAQNAYELYEILLPHVQLLPAEHQLSIIAELAHSKKAIAHEVSVLMLLHPKSSVRKHIAQLLCSLSDERLFTPVDLRRLIVIRNWVPSAERQDIDKLIARLRKKGMAPAPFLGAKISNLVGSSMDGAGASFILLESKKNNKRQVSGFITKLGVGIRDPWTISKAPKHYFDGIMKDKGETPTKTVSTAYVNKLVQHFLSEAINSGEVPEPNFLQISEIFGAQCWQPQQLSWADELTRLREKQSLLSSQAQINESLRRSGEWHMREVFTNSWFESGEHVPSILIEATEAHKMNSTLSLEEIATDYLIKRDLEKWKMILLITCQWMRTKVIDRRSEDLSTVLESLDREVLPSSIPLLRNITGLTMANLMRREGL